MRIITSLNWVLLLTKFINFTDSFVTRKVKCELVQKITVVDNLWALYPASDKLSLLGMMSSCKNGGLYLPQPQVPSFHSPSPNLNASNLAVMACNNKHIFSRFLCFISIVKWRFYKMHESNIPQPWLSPFQQNYNNMALNGRLRQACTGPRAWGMQWHCIICSTTVLSNQLSVCLPFTRMFPKFRFEC